MSAKLCVLDVELRLELLVVRWCWSTWPLTATESPSTLRVVGARSEQLRAIFTVFLEETANRTTPESALDRWLISEIQKIVSNEDVEVRGECAGFRELWGNLR
ncbi:hypothetical protein QR680_001486 [Steinernema hermaphroditum]|uniref:Uncharacterized protein n=1 Tax=Steinernema hermaphroditum TaxID=289476 RepID=A0AA39GYH4_9BILA|nr:hypothetical protein QR680_001486 [Steinernema hermaphroditum]